MKLQNFIPALSFIAVITLALVFSGCNLFDKVDDVKIPAEFDVTWNVSEDQASQNVSFSVSEVISLESNDQVKQYLNKIKAIEIESITYRIEDFNNDPHGEEVMMTNAYVTFGSTGSNPDEVTVPFTAEASGVALSTTISDVELNIDEQALSTLANILKDEKELSMSASGGLSKTPVAFKVVSKIKVKITAEVLE